jgi:hypothetical protein
MSWMSLRQAIMLGAAGPKACARRPIALYLLRSGGSIWLIAADMAHPESTQPYAAWGT